MGRKRAIEKQVVLDAVERVVTRDGIANLTIDAVAREAGVTKSTVLYDHKSKQALIEAVVERALQRDRAGHARVEACLKASQNRAIKGRIVAISEPSSTEFGAVALNLCAALTPDAGLCEKIQSNHDSTIARILETSQFPRGALLAYLALEGLKFLEHFGLHRFGCADRDGVLREINWLAATAPHEMDLAEAQGQDSPAGTPPASPL